MRLFALALGLLSTSCGVDVAQTAVLDTHVALAVISGSLDYLWEQDLVPFRAAVAAGVASVMVRPWPGNV